MTNKPSPQEDAPAGREPKDREWWHIRFQWREEGIIEGPALYHDDQQMPPNSAYWRYQHLVIRAKEVVPIAPVASHATVKALIEALEKIKRSGGKYYTGDGHAECVELANAALTQAKADGLLEEK